MLYIVCIGDTLGFEGYDSIWTDLELAMARVEQIKKESFLAKYAKIYQTYVNSVCDECGTFIELK